VKVGEAIASLREEDVLVLATGGIVHNLRDLEWDKRGTREAAAWARDFNDWIADRVERKAVDDLSPIANAPPMRAAAIRPRIISRPSSWPWAPAAFPRAASTSASTSAPSASTATSSAEFVPGTNRPGFVPGTNSGV
jgi:4,5-DOPA dioxygenase extradiol